MKILIDICHPAHVHLYKNLYFELKNKSHKVLVTVRDIPLAVKLLHSYNIPHIIIGKKSDTIRMKLLKQVQYVIKLSNIIKKLNIDLTVGSSITLAHVTKLTGVPSIWFDDDDDEVEPLITKLGHPFVSTLISPDVLNNKRKRSDTLYYAGYHELAYLHPKRFNPDFEIIKEAKLQKDEKYFILRFNSFKAHHDLNAQGISIKNKKKLINLLLKYGKVFVTTEREIDPEFEQYKITISPHKIHSFIAHSYMLIGDSQTMTSEAAVLGIPSIRCNSFVNRISYLDEQQNKYGLTYGFTPEQNDEMFLKIEELLNESNLREAWTNKRNKLLEDKIDVSSFMVWFVENYPNSKTIIQADPNYQFNFR